MALGVLICLGITGTALIAYSSSALRTVEYKRSQSVLYPVAEAGVADALSVLNNSLTPTSSTILGSAASPRTTSVAGGTATWYGTYNATSHIWTITSTAVVANPVRGTALSQTITRQVAVNPSANGDWDRIYNDDTTACMTIPSINVPGKLTTRGDLCLQGTTKLTGSVVEAGGNVTLEASSAIGSSTTPVTTASIGGTCKYTTAAAHKPCSSTDRVYASTFSTAGETATMPQAEWDYWYANAAPGPMHPCTVSSGTPPKFDKNTTYNRDNAEQELTPEPGTQDNPGSSNGGTIGNTSYVCQVWSGGQKIGELSWNNQTRVLTVQGTIFFDGNAVFHDHNGYVVHYQGRATMYLAGNWHNDEAVCAGGSGLTSCRNATSMPNWDPSQNLLVILAGDKKDYGNKDMDMHTNYSAFQGLLYATNDCNIHDSAYMSGPVICGDINLTGTPQLYSWPPLGALLSGQTEGTGAYQVSILSQSG